MLVYLCPKCKRWLQAVDNQGIRTHHYYTATYLYCPKCKIGYPKHNYKCSRNKIPVWKTDEETKKTKKGHYYKLGFYNGSILLLFHHYHWYPPTRNQIFNTKDDELINIYTDIDSRNHISKYL